MLRMHYTSPGSKRFEYRLEDSMAATRVKVDVGGDVINEAKQTHGNQVVQVPSQQEWDGHRPRSQ